MSDFLTPADIESILGDPRWPRHALGQEAKARCAALPLPGAVSHEINFKGGRRWMTDERPGPAPWWRFWE